jgi:hypothetical protein
VKTALYVGIILALAAAVAFLPAAGVAAGMFIWLIGILFWGALAWFLAVGGASYGVFMVWRHWREY